MTAPTNPFTAPPKRRKPLHQICAVTRASQRIEKEHGPDMANFFNDALANEEWMAKSIKETLQQQFNITVNAYTISRHRRGDCTCE